MTCLMLVAMGNCGIKETIWTREFALRTKDITDVDLLLVSEKFLVMVVKS